MTQSQGLKLFTLIATTTLAGILLGPTLATPFRAEDYLDLDRYSRHSPFIVFVSPHIGATIVALYRPLSDFLDALMVCALGVDPWRYHLVLALFMVANAWLIGRLGAALWPGGGGELAGVLAALLYIAHPLQQGALAYFEGGMAHVSLLFFTLLALDCYLRHRAGGGVSSYLGFVLFLLAAMLCFDGALILPLALVLWEVCALVPAAARHDWRRRLALLLPVFALVVLVALVRKLILGTMLGGYGLPLSRALIEGFPRGFALLLARLLTPTFHCLEPELPAHIAGFHVALGVVVAALLALVFARPALRAALAALMVAIVVLGPSTLDFVNEAIATGDVEPVSSYRLNLPLAMMGLAAAFALVGAASRLGRARVPVVAAVGLVLVVQHVSFARVFRFHNHHAGVMAETVRSELLRQAPPAPAPVFLVDTPLAHGPPGCAVMRVFPWGLASALRSPCSPRDVLVYPILEDPGQLIFRPGAVAALCSLPGTTAFCYVRATNRVEPCQIPAPAPVKSLPITAPRSGDVVDLQGGSLVVELETSELHDLVIVVVNRLAPFYLANRPPGLSLPIARTPAGFTATVGGAYLEQIRVYFAEDPVYLYAEDLAGKTVLARSEVLRLELRERGEQ